MKSKGICLGYVYRKEGGYLPCSHPIAGEEIADLLFDSAHFAFATAYGNIRRRLGLCFKESSWDVKRCNGRGLHP